MKKKLVSNSVYDTQKIIKDFCKDLEPKDLILLYGDLGAGKTVIAKTIANFFGVKDDVISPTFNILKQYKTKNKKIKLINHFDLYRIKNESELLDIDFNDFLYNDTCITLIEWPEIGDNYYIRNNIKINIIKKEKENEREIEIIK